MPSVDLSPYFQPQGSTSDGTKFDNLLGVVQTTLNGLDNNNVANAAAIAASKLSGIATVLGTQNVGSANTDLQGPGASRSDLYVVTTGTGTLRSIGAPTENGSRVLIRNGSGSSFTLKHQLAGGTGAQLYLRTVADVTLLDKEIVEFAYDGTNWVEVNRDQAAAGGGTQGTELDYKQITADVTGINATTEGTAVAVITGNSITYDGTRVKVDVYAPEFVATGGSGLIQWVILRDSTVLGQARAGRTDSTVTSSPGGVHTVFDTPSAAAHIYKAAAFVTAGTFTVKAGAGGSGVYVPAFLRVTKA